MNSKLFYHYSYKNIGFSKNTFYLVIQKTVVLVFKNDNFSLEKLEQNVKD